MLYRTVGIVEQIIIERPGLQELAVNVDSQMRTAINLLDVNPRAEPGTTVMLNTVAVELGLGTGGMDFVTAVLENQWTADPPGHILKLRYTPLQMPTLAVESQESPSHTAISEFESLQGCPVVCCGLHSQISAVCGTLHKIRQNITITYIMTDEAALPISLSHTVSLLKKRGLIKRTITCGQAFGGDIEAVNLYSALAAARAVAKADLIVVSQGPGNVGTGTPLGFSGIGQGQALNAVAALNGVPIAVPRISFADMRERHHGISHHTLTVLERITLAPALIALPILPEPERSLLQAEIDASSIASRHKIHYFPVDAILDSLISEGIPFSTMGRNVQEDREFFLTASAAGILAEWYIP